MENQELIYINDNTTSVGEINYKYNPEYYEISFETKIKGVIDSREHSIDEFKKELEELLKKYLI